MAAIEVPFHTSLSGRMPLLGLLPTALVLLGIVLWVAGAMYSTLRASP